MRHLLRFVHFVSIVSMLFIFSSCEDTKEKLTFLPFGVSTAPAASAALNWLGSLDSAPVNPAVNDAYYNTTDRASYLWNGTEWQVLARDGANGAAGSGVVNWLGSLDSAPENPAVSDAYYNTADRASYLWDGTAWRMIARDGANGIDGTDGTNGTDGATGPAGPAGTNGSDGATGATGPAGPGITWTVVTGTSVTATRNMGYIANNASQVTITLPQSSSLTIGDIIEVTGSGTGGWRIAQNTDQSIKSSEFMMRDVSWTAHMTDAYRAWNGVASSSDGTKLVAGIDGGQIYTSADSGANWTARDSSRRWGAIASSADGTKLVALVINGQLYTSIDSGVNWTARDSNRNWHGVASSTDGTKLVACAYEGQIYTSTDSGVTWTARMTDTNRFWNGVASSADGTKLVAIVNGGQIYTSTDSGVTWTIRVIGPNRNWDGVASSADGTKLVACVFSGQIYTSSDSGISWTARNANRNWNEVASSSDGTKLVAGVMGGQIYTSTDSGVTWTARDPNRSWFGLASSADGMKLIAGSGGYWLYTLWQEYIKTTTTGTTGYIRGLQYNSVKLQYMGSNIFNIIYREGDLLGY